MAMMSTYPAPNRRAIGVGGIQQPMPAAARAKPMGVTGSSGDINSALEGLRSAVGYQPNRAGSVSGMRPPAMGGGPIKPMGDFGGPVMAGNELQPGAINDMEIMEKAGKSDIVNNKLELQEFSPPQQMAELNAAQPAAGDISQDMLVQGALSRAQQPGLVGAGGNVQQMGGGRFGGNPPPNVLARRGGMQGGGGPSGGIMDRRQMLNNRMRSRISSVPNLGLQQMDSRIAY